MPRFVVVFLSLCLSFGFAAGQAAVATPGDVTGTTKRTRAPAAQPASPPAPQVGARRPRSYQQCRAIAAQRRLRGAERRHFVTRCRLGYGRPLFRRRGPAPAASDAPVPAGPLVPAPMGAPRPVQGPT